jgi:cobalt/nickel transport system permease protein
VEHGFLDKYADLNGPIHKVDPRVKLFILLAAVAATSFLTETKSNIKTLYLLLAAAAALLWLTGIKLSIYFKRMLIVLPPILVLSFVYSFKNGTLNSATFTFYALKALISFTFLFVLVGTTRFENLLKALKFFKVPALGLSLLAFLYRYIFVIQDELERMQRAKDLKLPFADRKLNLKATFYLVGMIFLRSFERSERIYRSMIARGYNPEKMFRIEIFRPGYADFLFILSSLLYLWLILELR